MISAADNTGWWLNVCVKHRAKEKNKNKKENKIKIGLFFQHGNVKDNLDKQGLMDLRLYAVLEATALLLMSGGGRLRNPWVIY